MIKNSVVGRVAALILFLCLGTASALYPSTSSVLDLTSGVVDVVVRGNELSARIELPGGNRAEIPAAFEEVEGLSLESLGLSAMLPTPL